MSLSDRELEALSAYLDGELSGKALVRMEARIQENQELRDTFEQLNNAKTLMRGLPKMRAPRNYLLTPQMVGSVRQPRRAFPVLRFASVLATLLLVLVFLGDVFMVPNQVMSPSRAVQLAESAVEEVEQPVLEAEIIESQLPEAPEEQSMERAELEGDAPPAAAEAIISPSADSTLGLEKLLATAIPAPVEEMEDGLGEFSEPVDEPNLEIEMRDQVSQSDEEVQTSIDLQAVLRISEIVLIVIAISTGLGAFLLFRKDK